MALRRPPTRIDLKPEDIEEYDEVSETRVCFMRSVTVEIRLCRQYIYILWTQSPCAVECQIVKERKMAEVGAPSPRKHAKANKSDKASSRSERKPSAAERIGIGRPR